MITFLSFLILFILLCFIASWWIVKRSTWIKNDGLPENTTAWGRIGFLTLRLVSVFVLTGVLLFTAFVSDRSSPLLAFIFIRFLNAYLTGKVWKNSF